MKKATVVLTAILLIVALLSGCGSSEQSSSILADSSEHEHNFAPADCENPQTCSCGATRGNAVGHSWYNATCTTPKICLACEKTEGEALGHKFEEGSCTVCFEYDPETAVDSPKVWISKDNLYHGNRICSNPPEEPNRESTLAKAREAGVQPCPRCYTAN